MQGLEDYLKGDDSSFGSQTYQKQHNYTSERDLVNHYTTFYDQDSNDAENQPNCSVKEVTQTKFRSCASSNIPSISVALPSLR